MVVCAYVVSLSLFSLPPFLSWNCQYKFRATIKMSFLCEYCIARQLHEAV